MFSSICEAALSTPLSLVTFDPHNMDVSIENRTRCRTRPRIGARVYTLEQKASCQVHQSSYDEPFGRPFSGLLLIGTSFRRVVPAVLLLRLIFILVLLLLLLRCGGAAFLRAGVVARSRLVAAPQGTRGGRRRLRKKAKLGWEASPDTQKRRHAPAVDAHKLQVLLGAAGVGWPVFFLHDGLERVGVARPT